MRDRSTPHLLDDAPNLPQWKESTFCPRYHRAVELIGRRWMGAILRVLIGGPQRFNALLTSIPGLSDRLLSERLRELEATGLVVRRVLPGPPVGVEYTLTEPGRDLEPAVGAICDWAETWMPGSQGPATRQR